MRTKCQLSWALGYSAALDFEPADFVDATAPGAVQLDYGKAHDYPDYRVADNFLAYRWMEDVYWTYQAILSSVRREPDERIYFVSKGIDYQCEVRIGRTVIHRQTGMFTPIEIDLTGLANPGDILQIVIFPAPKSQRESVDRTQANHSCKPAVSYGWDFHPRLIPLGIWDETYIETRSSLHFAQSEVSCKVNDDFQSAIIAVHFETTRAEGSIRWQVEAPNGDAVVDKRFAVSGARGGTLEAIVPEPALWWPNGQGPQALYRSIVTLIDADGVEVDRSEAKVGVRRIRLVMNEGAWEEPSQFPKSRSNPPITLEVNGRRIFAKGTNWVAPEIFPGLIDAQRYQAQLAMIRTANMNIVRVWGGAIMNKESFYDLCDEMGILVWQEFPLACNEYPDDPAYLQVLDQESRSIIRRLRSHPCVAFWCGGNELFNKWSGMTDQSLPLRLINRNCYDLDPERPFIMTSPIMGMGHGNYLFLNFEGEEVFAVMPRAANTAYTEFGCGGAAPADVIRSVIPAEELFPPASGGAWEVHHAFNAWGPTPTHLMPDTIERYFGKSPDLETLVSRSQILQAACLKCIFEEARRQKPFCSMALNWCFNEPWPCAANNSLVAYPNEPKAAYYATAESCRPTLASARVSRFQWCDSDLFMAEICMLHDGPEPFPAGRITASLAFADGSEVFLLHWDHAGADSNTNLIGPVARRVLPVAAEGVMRLILRAESNPGIDSNYVFVYRLRNAVSAPATAVLNQ